MGRYAAFRTSLGFGPDTTGPAGEPPLPGAAIDGDFDAYGDGEAYFRWVVELDSMEDLRALAETAGCDEAIFLPRATGRYGLSGRLMGGIDGIIEAYDGERE